MKGQATATIETIVIVTLHSDDKKMNGKQFERKDTRQVQVTHLSITDEIVDLDYIKLGNRHPGSVIGLKEISNRCEWKYDDDGYFETECGKAFCTESGTLAENSFKSCIYCGKPIKEIQTEEKEGIYIHIA